jgi:uncharacterized protein (UPF0276 family)
MTPAPDRAASPAGDRYFPCPRAQPDLGWTSHAGVGLKPQHVDDIIAQRPQIGFFEIHAENYMGAGGPPHRHLTAIRERHPLSIHGVGLSLGGAAPLDVEHLERLAVVVLRYEPALISEHLAWSSHQGRFLADLLPPPYTPALLRQVIDHIDQVQSRLSRRILLENPSTYLAFEESTIEETEFLAEVARRTGCGLLLDVNNVYVASANLGRDPFAYLAAFPLSRVGEIHLAGHASRLDPNGAPLLIDAHDRAVAEPVWALYRWVIDRLGPIPTLVERDADIPPWTVLYAEAQRAQGVMNASAGGALALVR